MIAETSPRTLAEAAGLRLLPPAQLRLWQVADELRCELAGVACWGRVEALQAYPMSAPKSHICLRDAAHQDIGLVLHPEQLSAPAQEALRWALERRCFTTRITRIRSLRERAPVVAWEVETERGPCTFEISDTRDRVLRPSPHRVLVTDLTGRRFLIEDTRLLDRQSRRLLQLVL